jgi:NAD(P)-dependent dehydrogenase (short-subunit alcohol dehydrogenase family)
LADGTQIYDLTGKNAVITGGGGALGTSISCGLAQAGARVAITDVSAERAEFVAGQLRETCGHAVGYGADVMRDGAIEELCEKIYQEFGKVDILVNCVGGNIKEATTSEDVSFFDLSIDAVRQVFELNFIRGVAETCQVFGKRMVENKDGGSIINISSMAALRPLTRVVGYSASKAAVSNFTQWLAVHVAKEFSANLRVNALAPGFFLTAQNQFLLTDDRTGELTERGQTIINHTPAGDFGISNDLVGATVWLASNASRFVTGIVLPIDGGFSAFSGV